MPFTFKADLDAFQLDLHAKIQVHLSVHSVMRLLTNRQTYDVQTITSVAPNTLYPEGVKLKKWGNNQLELSVTDFYLPEYTCT